MPDVEDVVVVGGGIGGAALSYALAREGLSIRVLEASEHYEDRVRGESMQLWGIREARELGVEPLLRDAGAHIAPLWKQYVEGVGEVGDIPVGLLMDGFDGSLNLRHPAACQALIEGATEAGATVVRGVRDVKVSGGRSPSVTYGCAEDTREVTASLIVGADGRASTIRRQSGVGLERQEPVNYIAGLLVDGLDGVPETDVFAGDRDSLFLLFHQGGGRARVYLCSGLSGQHRFSGPSGTQKFLDACKRSCFPWSESVSLATPAGPCATYPGDDTWTAKPFTDGVVLIGDAAGYNDPIIGQGLSIAMRDARIVRDLVLEGARTPEAFAPYGVERSERMRRLRFIADLMSASLVEDASNRQARRAFFVERMARADPEIIALLMGAFVGPETVPDELVDDSLLDDIRGA